MKLFQFITKLILNYRLTTWRSRALPDFIIIGAQKAGTTSLYAYLCQHPQILSPASKEIHFFDGDRSPGEDNFEKGESWYRSHFPRKSTLGIDKKTFEATPFYLFNPLVPKRIFKLIPKVKLIVLLRNPTERALSHYFLEKRNNRESLPVLDALMAEDNRLESVIKKKEYRNKAFRYHTYKSRGLYKNQIERYLNYFSRKQILIIDSEKLSSDTNNTLKQIFGFLDVDTKFVVNDLTKYNIASNKTQVDPEVYEYLNNYFHPHNEELYKLIGEDFGW